MRSEGKGVFSDRGKSACVCSEGEVYVIRGKCVCSEGKVCVCVF